jgi:hypothetical protein
MESFLPDRKARIILYRVGRVKSGFYRAFVKDWRRIQRLIRARNGSLVQTLLANPDAIYSTNNHNTSLQDWYCDCSFFAQSPYHLCIHLVRVLPINFTPFFGEVHRQRTAPVLWIKGVHSSTQLNYVPAYTSDGVPDATIEHYLRSTVTDVEIWREEVQRRLRDLAVGEALDIRLGLVDDEGPEPDPRRGFAADWVDPEILYPRDEEEIAEEVDRREEG